MRSLRFLSAGSGNYLEFTNHQIKRTEGYEMTRKSGFLAFLIILIGISLASAQAVPDQISYQGMLNDQIGQPVSGTVSFTFALYAVESGGAALWSESQNIAVSNGIFSVNLGASTPLDQTVFREDALYLGIRAGADQEMTPRQRMVSGAFAQTAGTVETLLNGTVLPKNEGRDSSIVSYYGETSTNVVLGVIPVDKTFIITDIKCFTSAENFIVALSYDAGAGYVRVYFMIGEGPFSGTRGIVDQSFKSGIPIPGGASLRLSEETPSYAYCTVAGFEIPAI